MTFDPRDALKAHERNVIRLEKALGESERRSISIRSLRRSLQSSEATIAQRDLTIVMLKREIGEQVREIEALRAEGDTALYRETSEMLRREKIKVIDLRRILDTNVAQATHVYDETRLRIEEQADIIKSLQADNAYLRDRNNVCSAQAKDFADKLSRHADTGFTHKGLRVLLEGANASGLASFKDRITTLTKVHNSQFGGDLICS